MRNKRRFAKMYASYADDIFRFIYVHVRDEMLAEDLTSDTFAKAWQKIEGFDFRQPRAWLYTIARNRIADHWRTRHTVPLAEDYDPEDERDSIEVEVDRVTLPLN
jgi:RNA polymerase sigma-70 factor (ECF subfamily)